MSAHASGSAGSLRLRLLVGAAVSLLVALIVAGLALSLIFERHVSRRLDAELVGVLNRLAATVAPGPDGRSLSIASPADPQFTPPFSGRYWQVTGPDGRMLRSRSLWDQTLVLPDDRLADGAIHRHLVAGPQAGTRVIVLERSISLAGPAADVPVRIAAAVDERELDDALRVFRGDLALSLGLLGAVLFVASWLQTLIGLRPLELIRGGVEAIRTGRASRLSVAAPREVEPLISEINQLLESAETETEQARARAADLAHGLKTPLTILSRDVERLRQRGLDDIAGDLEEVWDVMRRHVEHQLVRARTRGRVRHRTALAEPLLRVLRVAERAQAGRDLEWRTDLHPDVTAAIDIDDLAEIAGNLLENAGKWARRVVSLRMAREGGNAIITIEDDGPGVPDEHLHRILRRGERADENVAGSGLGLAIAREITEACGGSLTLARSALGGLAVRIALPEGA